MACPHNTGLLTDYKKNEKNQNCSIHLEITTNLNVMVEQFCKSILQTVSRNTKALANLVMGLASQTSAKSVVEISLGKCYHYQYSSINKTIDALDRPIKRGRPKAKGGGKEKLSRREVEKKFACQGRTF